MMTETSDGHGWRAISEHGETHLIPLGDLRDHEPTPQCWCNPERVDAILAHRAMDRREEYEDGRRFS
jgi:hypothetical protein